MIEDAFYDMSVKMGALAIVIGLFFGLRALVKLVIRFIRG